MRLIWSAPALADKDAIWLYLADRNIDYADRVETRIETRAASLLRFPHQGRPIPESDLRALSIPDTTQSIRFVCIRECV